MDTGQYPIKGFKPSPQTSEREACVCINLPKLSVCVGNKIEQNFFVPSRFLLIRVGGYYVEIYHSKITQKTLIIKIELNLL